MVKMMKKTIYKKNKKFPTNIRASQRDIDGSLLRKSIDMSSHLSTIK